MAGLLVGRWMARNDVNVKLDSGVVKDAKVVAAWREVTMAEYLSEMLRPLVQRDLQQEMTKRLRSEKARDSRPAKGGERDG